MAPATRRSNQDITAVEPEEHPESAPAHRARGRPSKGGETTKIAGTDSAAAEQLQQELADSVATSKTTKSSGKRKRAETTADASQTTRTPQFWLMKAEQDDREVKAHSGKMINAKFTIDDLQSRTAPEPWDGVRNIVARNNMRAMTKGDQAFFYASGGTGKNKPGITGVMEIVKEHEADFTMSDEDAYGYVEPGKRGTEDKPQWSIVHVEFRRKLAQSVTLKKLQEYSGPGQALHGMQVLTHSRISVSKVTPEQWRFIMDELVTKDE